ncbi:TIGR03084 family metal-binding protein [Streptomyces iconiensis]|uniref:TIGR03084 family metal-binding protein n=1 Tax=Streptomyces iconiensis TaxID=1384038 RepID=A0ABT7AAW4_9ACTN|nr:TIGR03084 family metal-binding protein [Streptomyces iconiensis]MDJ1138488.1 TIGR03084 family metal-binding protein [Streptomyces iconiensis]
MAGPGAVFDEMRDEGDELDRLVADLEPARWAAPTPAPGWTVAHQIAHLAWTDQRALLAATEAEAFRRETERYMESGSMDFIDEGAEEGAQLAPAALLESWRTGRADLLAALSAQPGGARLPWYGMPMSAAGMATARIMEMWAHGEDVADALGVTRVPTARLRQVVRIGVRARDYAYAVHGLEPPGAPFRVELTAPDGSVWAHGPEEAAQRVTGEALDFCRLVTQRVHRSDAAVRAEGADAERWLGIAQSFAGPPGVGRAASGRAGTGSGRPDPGPPGAGDAPGAGPAAAAGAV